MSEAILAEVRASPVRRGLGLAVLIALGLLLIYLALLRPPALGWQVFVLLLGLAALWAAERLRRATALAVRLTREGLFCSDGERIAAFDEIEAVDRGAFAFKPSNGFILRLRAPAPARWQPGLWWRLGRRVGVGGVTPGAQAKVMADILASLLAERDAAAEGRG